MVSGKQNREATALDYVENAHDILFFLQELGSMVTFQSVHCVVHLQGWQTVVFASLLRPGV